MQHYTKISGCILIIIRYWLVKDVTNVAFFSFSLCMQAGEHMRDMLSGMHNWYACSHARPTYCNVCREALSGVTSHGLSCEGELCMCFCMTSGDSQHCRTFLIVLWPFMAFLVKVSLCVYFCMTSGYFNSEGYPRLSYGHSCLFLWSWVVYVSLHDKWGLSTMYM